MPKGGWEDSGDLRDYWRETMAHDRQYRMDKITGSPGLARLHPVEPEWATTPVRPNSWIKPKRDREPVVIPKPVPAPMPEPKREPVKEPIDAMSALEALAAQLGVKIVLPVAEPVEEKPEPITIHKIVREVAFFYDLSPREIIGKRRTHEVMAPRHEAMLLARTLTEHSLPGIGRQFGNRDHTTVLNGIGKALSRMGLAYPRMVAGTRQNGRWMYSDKTTWADITARCEARWVEILSANEARRLCEGQ